jgi:hypothetical protein
MGDGLNLYDHFVGTHRLRFDLSYPMGCWDGQDNKC